MVPLSTQVSAPERELIPDASATPMTGGVGDPAHLQLPILHPFPPSSAPTLLWPSPIPPNDLISQLLLVTVPEGLRV